jgi:pyrroloquinoline quinone (PQQ) biosynthesis protein C
MEQLHALDETLDRFCERLESGTPFKKLLDGNVDLDFYIRFLIQTYHYVRFTPCSLKLAADSLVDHPNPIYQSLGQRFKEHQAEEEGHDQWVLNDLRNLGQDPGIVERVLPSDEVAAYNAYSKFVVKSSSPVAILGEAFMLEGISQRYGTSMAQNLAGRSGIPDVANAVSFLKGHGHTDQGHMAELRHVLELIADERDWESIVLCAKVVSQLYTAMIDGLTAQTVQRR